MPQHHAAASCPEKNNDRARKKKRSLHLAMQRRINPRYHSVCRPSEKGSPLSSRCSQSAGSFVNGKKPVHPYYSLSQERGSGQKLLGEAMIPLARPSTSRAALCAGI